MSKILIFISTIDWTFNCNLQKTFPNFCYSLFVKTFSHFTCWRNVHNLKTMVYFKTLFQFWSCSSSHLCILYVVTIFDLINYCLKNHGSDINSFLWGPLSYALQKIHRNNQCRNSSSLVEKLHSGSLGMCYPFHIHTGCLWSAEDSYYKDVHILESQENTKCWWISLWKEWVGTEPRQNHSSNWL